MKKHLAVIRRSQLKLCDKADWRHNWSRGHLCDISGGILHYLCIDGKCPRRVVYGGFWDMKCSSKEGAVDQPVNLIYLCIFLYFVGAVSLLIQEVF